MPTGKYKSGHFRRVFRRTPGARVVTLYRERKPSKQRCAKCDTVLSGVPRLRKAEAANTPKTAKRPERPFGGVLCSRCSRDLIKKSTRAK